MKKATRIVVIISLVLDYLILAGVIFLGFYLFFNIGRIANSAASSASVASSGGADEELAKGIAGVATAFGSALMVVLVVFLCGVVALFMVFPIITLHSALKQMERATCREEMLRIGVIALLALQIPAGILLIATPSEEYQKDKPVDMSILIWNENGLTPSVLARFSAS